MLVLRLLPLLPLTRSLFTVGPGRLALANHLLPVFYSSAAQVIRIPPGFDPSLDSSLPSDRPPALFLPGLDGQGIYAIPALTNLSRSHDLYKLNVPPDDRSTFLQVADLVTEALTRLKTPAVLIGDSCGALIACFVAARSPRLVSNLVLINPATSFDRTAWSLLAPMVVNTGPAYNLLGPLVFTAGMVEPEQAIRIGGAALRGLVRAADPGAYLNDLLALVGDFVGLLPPATVRWRVSRWLEVGNRLMTSRYKQITVPTLLLLGKVDKMLPSEAEGFLLEKRLSNAAVEVREFETRGHMLLDDKYLMRSKLHVLTTILDLT